ncbi:response regulator [Algoriphagus sp. D3-2-R+10]|uniref:response regulator n=1 Tax=Algoriphagus aurantiacus TaxID=3103948 RepID=UPI002B3AB370|nr:response regulator [Algoriphagus sp. D3-2-R+10]MEB2778298.1 response regulator [Algoriphagus sp. D3-2-R+10]
MKNSNLSVLVIEDNEGDFILVEDFLIESYKKIHIQHCIDFDAAKKDLIQQNNEYTAILLDLNLPGLSGIELINEMLKICKNTPIIVLTGYGDVNLARQSIELGVYDFLIKDEINPSLLQKSIDFSLSRKNFTSQLEGERENYKSLFNLSPQPMWLLHPDNFRILDVNEATIEKYGYSLDECLSLTLMDLHPAQESELLIGKLVDIPAQNANNQFTQLKKNGEEIKVELSLKKMIFNTGRKGIIVQSTDITTIIDHVKTIEQQNEKLKNIAWTQSHVVRAPLSRILGIINLIETQRDSLDDLTFWLNQLRISSDEMDAIVRKITEESQYIQLNRNNE